MVLARIINGSCCVKDCDNGDIAPERPKIAPGERLLSRRSPSSSPPNAIRRPQRAKCAKKQGRPAASLSFFCSCLFALVGLAARRLRFRSLGVPARGLGLGCGHAVG